ncbi:EAL domain-containing protein/glycosyl transferase [Halomicronema hongdechloris C2206]|uniref:EAL domain-containing protein/glycosyl transferase n=1 Tax=Halomicronema hongdechloris C2206 TaxID=1641165 RepID=A0A1Z3HPI5_9CYAN|nr:glycosyltransferase [Halomicronema hongdechloris]ASC72172.1 EAL domain-containing protein/glycosyl transferase [Halomicronema hongdechloris C2206]
MFPPDQSLDQSPDQATSATTIEVSVVVPVYNGEQDLPQLLAGLRSQTYPRERVEYLLVDNGSCDRTPELLQTACEQAQPQGLTLRSLRYDTIQSSYAARNAGIRATRGAIVAFTDADCAPDPEWLTHLISPFSEATVGLVVGEIQAQPSTTLLEHYADHQGILSQTNTLAHPFCPYGQTANLAIRRLALEKVGLFRPHLTTGGDADMCWRLQQQGGWQLRFAEQAVIRHRHRQTLAELRRQWQRYGRSNRFLHELYGVQLMRPLYPKETRYRLLRWVGKELPQGLFKWLTGRGSAIDLIVTPLDLICANARTQGQQHSALPPRGPKPLHGSMRNWDVTF